MGVLPASLQDFRKESPDGKSPCVSPREPQAEAPCMGNQPDQLQEQPQAQVRCIDKRNDFLYTSVRILSGRCPPQ